MAININDNGGERTRFPFLAIVRSVVAVAVSALTLVVIVRVIAVALRPLNIRLSIVQGFVEADTLWVEEVTISNTLSNSGSKAEVVVSQREHSLQAGFGIGGGDEGVTYTSYVPAKYVNLVVSVRAQNPSGRAHMECYDITMRILDMGNTDVAYYNSKLVDLGTFSVSEDRFSVELESSYTVRTLLTLDNTGHALTYIAATYGGRSSFHAMLEVNATISDTTPVTTTGRKVVSHYCWPVTVGSYVPSTDAGEVTCMPSEEMSYTIHPVPPAT